MHYAEDCRQHKTTGIRNKSNNARKQPPCMCKNNNSNIACELAIGQYHTTNPECTKAYTDHNFQIVGQARSSFHLSFLETVYIKTQYPVLCRQTEFIFLIGLFTSKMVIGPNWSHLRLIRRILSRVMASGYIFR